MTVWSRSVLSKQTPTFFTPGMWLTSTCWACPYKNGYARRRLSRYSEGSAFCDILLPRHRAPSTSLHPIHVTQGVVYAHGLATGPESGPVRVCRRKSRLKPLRV